MSLFGGLNIYTVHVKTDVVRSSEKPVFVREGFNPFAFFFTVLWMLSKRLWLPALGIVAAFAFIIFLGVQQVVTSTSVGILQLAMQVVIGFHANDWLRHALEKRGYITTDITTGDSLLRAERRYFERYLKTVSV